MHTKKIKFGIRRLLFKHTPSATQEGPEVSAGDEKEQKDKPKETVPKQPLPTDDIPINIDPAEKALTETGKDKPDKSVDIENKPIPRPSIPERNINALGGKKFMESLGNHKGEEREARIREQLESGNVPDFLREFKTIEVDRKDANGDTFRVKLFVMPDFLSIGSNDDYVRMPMSPLTAQVLADKYNCILPTKTIVDIVHDDQGTNKVVMKAGAALQARSGKIWGENMKTNEFYALHNDMINEDLTRARHQLGTVVSGIKKELIITNKLINAARENKNFLAFHGGLMSPYDQKIKGKRFWQNGADIAHEPTYVDYSHGVRMISRYVEINGKPYDLVDVLRDPVMCKLVTDEGVTDATAFYRRGMGAIEPKLPVKELKTPPPLAPQLDDFTPPPPAISHERSYAEMGGRGVGEPVTRHGREIVDHYTPPPSSSPSPAMESAPETVAQNKVYEPTLFIGDSISVPYKGDMFANLAGGKTFHTMGGKGVVYNYRFPPDFKMKNYAGKMNYSMVNIMKDLENTGSLDGPNAPKRLVILGGTNDVGAVESNIIIQALSKIYSIARKHGIKIYACTIPPFGGYKGYRHKFAKVEQRRQEVNNWIISNVGKPGGPDVVIPLHEEMAAKSIPTHIKLRPSESPSAYMANEYAGNGDQLHPTPNGSHKMADIVNRYIVHNEAAAGAPTPAGDEPVPNGNVPGRRFVNISPDQAKQNNEGYEAVKAEGYKRVQTGTDRPVPRGLHDAAMAALPKVNNEPGQVVEVELPNGQTAKMMSEWHPGYGKNPNGNPANPHIGLAWIEEDDKNKDA